MICNLRKDKTIKGQNFLNLKFKKQIYIDRYVIFSVTKAMIPNDVDPFGGKTQEPGNSN